MATSGRACVLVLMAGAAWAAVPAPKLAVSVENAITRPKSQGIARLIRPLVLIVSDWQGSVPRVEAYSFAGTVTAECKRLKSAAGEWSAEVKYAVVEEVGMEPFRGELRLRLRVHGSIVQGDAEGSFNGLPVAGRVGAGLVFEHMYAAPHNGLLLWLPDLKNAVKGIVFWGNGANLDDRQRALHEDVQAFAAANGLAVIGTGEMSPWMARGEGQRILDGVHALAELSAHPELEKVPIYFMGHSNGGGMAIAFDDWLPGRTAAFVSSHGSPVIRKLAVEAVGNPGIFTAGEIDPKIPADFIEAVFRALRAQGARVSYVVEQGEQHAPGAGSMPFFLFALQHVVDGAPVDERRAWLGDHTTAKFGIASIYPAAEFPGDKNAMSWLVDQDVAYVWRGIATFDNPLKLGRADGHGPAYRSGEAVEIAATAFGEAKWKSIGLYDGAVRVGEITREKPRVRLTAQKAGAHAGVLVGEMADGELRTSIPVSWVVWP